MIHEKICAFFIACFLRFTFFASSIQALRSAEGHIDLTESDIASDKGEALIDEFVKLCEEYELSTFNVEKIISMFPDVSVDDFIYSERGYIGRSYEYEKPNTKPLKDGDCDIRLTKSVGYYKDYEDIDLLIYKPYIDNATGILGEIIGKIKTLDDFYKVCGYTFTNVDILKMAYPWQNAYSFHCIVLFNKGGLFLSPDINLMVWSKNPEYLKYIHTYTPDYIVMGYEEKVDIMPNCQWIDISLFYDCPEGVDKYNYLSYELSHIHIRTEKYSQYTKKMSESPQTGFNTVAVIVVAVISVIIMITLIIKRNPE